MYASEKYPEYTVAIRTLGTAGEKFEREIASLIAQSCKPKEIIAYIPHGYAIPDFPDVAQVRWVRSPKGMMTQRSLPFDEITSEYVLFLDDDVFLPVDGVAKLFDGLLTNNADAISANVFPNHEGSLKHKLVEFFNGYRFSFSHKWAFRIRKSSYYSYCNSPSEVMPSQSAAGSCVLIKKDVYKAVHLHEERWVEMCPFCFGEDQLFFQKLYRGGWRLMVHFNTGLVHLDAGTGHAKDPVSHFRMMETLRYILWHRTSYMLASGVFDRFVRSACYCGVQFSNVMLDLVRLVTGISPYKIRHRFGAIREGMAFTHTPQYKSLPRFDVYKKQ